MEIQHILTPVLGACVILLFNLMELYNIEPSKRPNFKDPIYWFPYFIHPILSAIIGWAYFSANDYSPMSALQIGAITPLFIKQVINVLPRGNPK